MDHVPGADPEPAAPAGVPGQNQRTRGGKPGRTPVPEPGNRSPSQRSEPAAQGGQGEQGQSPGDMSLCAQTGTTARMRASASQNRHQVEFAYVAVPPHPKGRQEAQPERQERRNGRGFLAFQIRLQPGRGHCGVQPPGQAQAHGQGKKQCGDVRIIVANTGAEIEAREKPAHEPGRKGPHQCPPGAAPRERRPRTPGFRPRRWAQNARMPSGILLIRAATSRNTAMALSAALPMRSAPASQ